MIKLIARLPPVKLHQRALVCNISTTSVACSETRSLRAAQHSPYWVDPHLSTYSLLDDMGGGDATLSGKVGEP